MNRESFNYEIIESVKSKMDNDIFLLRSNLSHNSQFTTHNSLVIGVFHGDEPQGKYLIERYINNHSTIQPFNPSTLQPFNHSTLFIPCLNPDGMAAKTRTNANGVDLNRNFPTQNWTLSEQTTNKNPEGQTIIGKETEKNEFFGGESPTSEIETQFLIDVIEKYKPKTILTLHAPYKVVNYDGPAQDLAQKVSDIINYPVEESIGYPTPGSFGTWAGIERGIPTITLELDETCPVEDLYAPVSQIFGLLS